MYENIKFAVLSVLWVLSWALLIVGAGFCTKILSYLFMLGWDII